MFRVLIVISTLFLTFCLFACNQTTETSSNKEQTGAIVKNNTEQEDQKEVKQIDQKEEEHDDPESRTYDDPFDFNKPITVSGTEPFWAIQINKEEVLFTGLGLDSVYYKTTAPKAAVGRPLEFYAYYELKGEKGDAKLFLRRMVNPCYCSDGMSGINFAYSAFFVSDDIFYEGCARQDVKK